MKTNRLNTPEYHRYRRHVLKRELVDMLGGKCTNCGYNKSLYALEFHHTDPTRKDFTISRNLKGGKSPKVLEELSKCILLCANCHRELHEELKGPIVKPDYILEGKEDIHVFKSSINLCNICGKEVRPRAKMCMECSKVSRRRVIQPSKDDLEKMVWEIPTTEIAKRYGVSDVAVSKWCKNLGISKPPRGYWAKLKAE